MSTSEKIANALDFAGIRCKHNWKRIHAIPGGMVVKKCSKCDARATRFDGEEGQAREFVVNKIVGQPR